MKVSSLCVSWVAIIIIFLNIAAAQPTYLQATAEEGQGVLSLLRTYSCLNDCNLKFFYELNSGVKKRGLIAKSVYRLPIIVYRYNGKSIRSTIGIQDRPRAENIQSYNEQMYGLKLKKGDYRKDRQLWVPYHFITCPEQESESAGSSMQGNVPIASKTPVGVRGNYALFGPKHARVPLYDNSLKGRVYYVIAGHGGPDPGAVARRGGRTLAEDEYAYDISLRLTRNLLSHGATVYMIVRDPNDGIRSGMYLKPDKDEVVWGNIPIPQSQKERLSQRSDIVNALYQKNRKRGVGFQRMIVIHIDSQRRKERTDMYFYYQSEDQRSKSFAQKIHATIGDKYRQYQKGRGYTGTVSTRDLHMLRETDPVGVFIELGNIKNPNDQDRWVIEKNRDFVAQWLAEGIMKDK